MDESGDAEDSDSTGAIRFRVAREHYMWLPRHSEICVT